MSGVLHEQTQVLARPWVTFALIKQSSHLRLRGQADSENIRYRDGPAVRDRETKVTKLLRVALTNLN